MNELREIRLRKALRGLVLVVAAFTTVAIVLGFLPGHEIYEDGILVERTSAGGGGFTQFACWLVAPGLVVWLHPRIGVALMWSVLAWIGTLMFLGAGFNLDGHGQDIQLWPAAVMTWLMGPVMFTLLLGMPFGLAIYESIIRRADARAAALVNVPLPAARVISRRPQA
jgi:hypothetical protein